MKKPEDTKPGWKPDPDDPNHKRFWNGTTWTQRLTTPEMRESRPAIPPNSDVIHSEGATQTAASSPLSVGIPLAGSVVLLVAVFLPRVETSAFSTIEQNTLLQSGPGIFLLLNALLAAVFTYQFTRKEGRRFSVLICGVICLAIAVWSCTGDRLELAPVGPGENNPALRVEAGPSLGIYATFVGGSLIAVGGFMLAGFRYEGVSAPPLRRSKRCPDCAEDVLEEARVCKHCGHRF
jgi:hypothetical protein